MTRKSESLIERPAQYVVLSGNRKLQKCFKLHLIGGQSSQKFAKKSCHECVLRVQTETQTVIYTGMATS